MVLKLSLDLISDAVTFGELWYGEPNAIGYAQFYSRSHDAVIHVYDDGSQCDRGLGLDLIPQSKRDFALAGLRLDR